MGMCRVPGRLECAEDMCRSDDSPRSMSDMGVNEAIGEDRSTVVMLLATEKAPMEVDHMVVADEADADVKDPAVDRGICW